MKTINTRTLEFRVIIKNYFLSCVESEGYNIELTTDKEKFQFVLDRFEHEYNYPANKKRYPNLQDRFTEWIKGLPSCFNIDFENHRILELAKEWNTLKYGKEDQIIENWFKFITVHFLRLADKEGIDTYKYI